VGIHNSVVIDS